MRKKTIIMGAMVSCLLLTSSATVFAAQESKFPGREGFDIGRGIFSAEIEARRENMKVKLAEIKDRYMDMSVYEQYGLTYDEGKDGWYYDGKLVGLFVDKNGRGITILSKDGEVHLKAIRDEAGNLIGLSELTDEEYTAILSEMEKIREDMNIRMNEMAEKMKSRMAERKKKLESFLLEKDDSFDFESVRNKIRDKIK
ncbi:MAG: hypothetical protein GX209_02585 [Epulopiscium sp.]|nr:hypothetical protein [Candidatus Epulonipiscium sp.]